MADDVVRVTALDDPAALNQDGAGAQFLERSHIVADKEDGAAFAGDVAHFAEAFFLERGVAYGENFVHEENFGLQVRGDGEGQAHLHAAAVMLERGFEESLDFGEGHDFVELAVDFGFAHAENGAAHVDVFAAGELGVKAGADFEQAADASVNFGVAFGGAGDAGQDLQQRALARAVAADEADDFALADFEIDVLQRPDETRAAIRSYAGVDGG